MFPYPSTTLQQPWAIGTDILSYQANALPYQSPIFLNQAFNSNQQSIAAFHTLTHEQKLQFYLSVEEMKLLGYMSNKQKYQSLLQQIARRKLILKKPETNSKKAKGKDLQVEWGAKLQHLVDDHLKKIQRQNFLDDIPISIPVSHHQNHRNQDFLTGDSFGSSKKKIQQDQFEWADSSTQQGFENKQNKADAYKSFEQLLINSNNIPVNSIYHSLKPVSKPVIIQPEVKVEHIDVWDLDVIDDEPKKAKAQQHQSQNVLNTNINSINSLPQASKQQQFGQSSNYIAPQNNFQSQTIFLTKRKSEQNYENLGMSNKSITDRLNSTEKGRASLNYVDNKKSEDDDQFQYVQSQLKIQERNTELFNINEQYQSLSTFQPVEVSMVGNQQNIFSKQNSVHFVQTSYTHHNPHNQTQDLNFIGIQKTDQIQSNLIQQQNTKPVIPSVFDSNSFSLDLSTYDQQFQPTFSIKDHDYLQNQSQNSSFHSTAFMDDFEQKEDQQSLMNSTILATVDTKFLDKLKRLPPTTNISKCLKKKFFDFDRIFYQQALNLIKELGYKQSQDYTFIKQQCEICEQIFRLTELYTAAVDQDKEDQVFQSLRKSKDLYSKLDSSKTAAVTKKYMKMEGKTLGYHIGKLCLEAGVPQYLIEKSMENCKFNEICTLLYLMVFNGNTFSIVSLTEEVVEYFNDIYVKMQNLVGEVSAYSPGCVKVIRESQKFREYKENLVLISKIVNRILQIGSFCFIEDTTEKFRLVKQKVSKLSGNINNQIIQQQFLAFFLSFASVSTNNVYTLHSEMNKFIDSHHICSVCLELIINAQEGQKNIDDKYYHFACWNLKQAVMLHQKGKIDSSSLAIQETF